MSKNFDLLFITQEDPFYVRIFFETFFKKYSALGKIKGVVICPTMGKKSFLKLIKQMYNFYGLIDFVIVGFRFVLYKIVSKSGNLLKSKQFYSLEQICKTYDIDVIKTNNINSPLFLERVEKMNIGIIISVAAPQIFKDKLLSLPRWSCINIHHAKLPKYRGMLPNFWQMLNNEKKAGITIHKMNPKLDDGEIISQTEIDIEATDSLDSLVKRSKKIGADLMIETLEKIEKNQIDYIKNEETHSTYYSFPGKKDVSKFRKAGKRLL